MKAIVLREAGGLKALRLETVDDPARERRGDRARARRRVRWSISASART